MVSQHRQQQPTGCSLTVIFPCLLTGRYNFTPGGADLVRNTRHFVVSGVVTSSQSRLLSNVFELKGNTESGTHQLIGVSFGFSDVCVIHWHLLISKHSLMQAADIDPLCRILFAIQPSLPSDCWQTLDSHYSVHSSVCTCWERFVLGKKIVAFI